ncbi:MAG: hypothetical protein ACKO4X_20225, partial [Alphaproteobacteria bacterium]
LLLIPLRKKQLSKAQRLAAAFTGAVAVWVSYPAIFVLTGLEAFPLWNASAGLILWCIMRVR